MNQMIVTDRYLSSWEKKPNSKILNYHAR